MIDFICECGFKTQVRDDFAGKKVKCPNCGQFVMMPTTSGNQVLPAKQADMTMANRKYSLPLILALVAVVSGAIGAGIVLVIMRTPKQLRPTAGGILTKP